MKSFFIVIIFGLWFAGCTAYVTPEGTYIEPLPAVVFVGPPVVVVPAPGIVVKPLPPVVLAPDRHVYFYGNLYYYYWDNVWYYSKHERGPWHKLPPKYYPKKHRRRF